MEDKKIILHFIQRVRIRLWLLSFLRLLARYMSFAAAFNAALMLYALYVPFYGAERVAAAVMGFFLACPLAHSAFTACGRQRAALAADKMGLKERVITSYEHMDLEDEWTLLQRKDTVRHIKGFSIREKFPVRVSYARLACIAALLAAAAIAGAVPTPAKEQAKLWHDIVKQAEEKEETLETVKEELREIADNKEITEEELERLQKILEDSVEEMKAAGSEAELEKAKERMETKLEQELSKNENMELAAALDKLSDSMNLTEKAEYAKQIEELAEKNQSIENAGDAFKELAKELTGQEMEQLLEQLSDMAETGELTDEELAEALASLSQSDAAALAAKIEQSGSASLGSGETQMAETASQEGSSGDGTGNGNGNGSGSGTGNGSGTGSGNGTGSGSGNGGGYNTGSKNGIEREIAKREAEESVTVQAKTGDDENLTGTASGQSKYKVKSKDGLTWSGSRVGYGKVIGEYTQDAYEKISNSGVPESMQDVVKSYFSELNQ